MNESKFQLAWYETAGKPSYFFTAKIVPDNKNGTPIEKVPLEL